MAAPSRSEAQTSKCWTQRAGRRVAADGAGEILPDGKERAGDEGGAEADGRGRLQHGVLRAGGGGEGEHGLRPA